MDAPYPASAFGDRVQLHKLAPGVNTGGGKVSSYVKTGGPLPCRVMRLAARAKDLEVVTEMETTFELSFPAANPAQPHDLFAWLDATAGGDPEAELDRIEVVEAPTPRDPGGRLWQAFGVIVQ